MPRFARVYFTFNRFLVETSFPEGGAFGVGGRLFLLLLLVVVTIINAHKTGISSSSDLRRAPMETA